MAGTKYAVGTAVLVARKKRACYCPVLAAVSEVSVRDGDHMEHSKWQQSCTMYLYHGVMSLATLEFEVHVTVRTSPLHNAAPFSPRVTTSPQ